MDFSTFFTKRLRFRQIFPWVFFAILCAICVGIFLNEKLAVRDKKDLLPCLLSSWSEWSGCEGCLDNGIRTRTVISGTDRCTNQLMVDTRACSDILNCGDQNCQYTQYTQWSDCPNLCFNNIYDCNNVPNQVRFRNVLRPALPGGIPCDWRTLIQERPCVLQGPCAPDLDCVVGTGSECAECPDIGCTLTESPFYTLCTRSILQSQSGNGRACSREQLLFSRSCNLPNCTQTCIENDLEAFQRCSDPCGPGLYFSSTCPSLTSGECNLGSCTKGGFVQTNDFSFCNGEFCPASEFDKPAVARCFAKAANSGATRLSMQSNGIFIGGNCTTATYPFNLLSDGYTWSSDADCVRVTWDMINAVCLYVCEGQPNYNRYVFPFEDGSLSCPIDLYMLSISNVCPAVGISSSGRPFGSEQFLTLSNNTVVESEGDITLSFTCPVSTDCEYQSYSDAKPWSQCNVSCANGGGERTRTRQIIKAQTFLGVPCDPFLTEEFAPCNQLSLLTSATDMWCESEPTLSSEFMCQYNASISGSRSMLILTTSQVVEEVFLVDAGLSLDSSSVEGFIPTLESYGVRYASYSQVMAAFGQGAQSCIGGWAFSDQKSLATPLPLYSQTDCEPFIISNPWIYSFSYSTNYCFFTNSLQQFISVSVVCPTNYGPNCSRTTLYSCDEGFEYADWECRLLDSLNEPIISNTVMTLVQQSCSGMPGRHIYAKNSVSNYVWAYGIKSSVTLPTLPFFTPTQNSFFDSSYEFEVQSFSNVACSLFTHRTDLVTCNSLSAQSLYTKSKMVDVPCNTAKDCSLSAWVDVTKCKHCIPPETHIQTRSIVAPATEGGTPCDHFLLTQNAPCTNSQGCIDPDLKLKACIPQSYSSLNVSPNACDAFTQSYPLIEVWNEAYIYAIADRNVLNKVLDMDDTLAMPDELAQALNAQVLLEDGTFATCTSGLDASGNLFNVYELIAGGWATSSCIPDSYHDSMLLQRQGSISRRYWDGTEWICGDPCPYLIDTCNFPPLINGACPCGTSYQRLTTKWRTFTDMYCDDFNPGGFATFTSKSCPNPLVPCASRTDCPTACDGSPCGSLSGQGFCYYNVDDNFYECSCTNGSLQKDCSDSCPVGLNGLVCSNNGVCEPNGTCSCNPGYSGRTCDENGTGIIGAFESLLYSSVFTISVNGEPMVVNAVNPLPCDEENNPACFPVQLTTESPIPLRHPIFDDNNFAYISANVCVNAGGATFDSPDVPSHLMMYKTSLTCEELNNGDMPGNDAFRVKCQFLNHPLVPPSLVGKQFYTRCMKAFNSISPQGTTYTYNYQRIQQRTADGDIFIVLGPYQNLDEVC